MNGNTGNRALERVETPGPNVYGCAKEYNTPRDRKTAPLRLTRSFENDAVHFKI
jgi:hypothetical protein